MNAARAYFTPERREAAIAIAKAWGVVENGTLYGRRNGYKTKAAFLERYASTFREAARALDG